MYTYLYTAMCTVYYLCICTDIHSTSRDECAVGNESCSGSLQLTLGTHTIVFDTHITKHTITFDTRIATHTFAFDYDILAGR